MVDNSDVPKYMPREARDILDRRKSASIGLGLTSLLGGKVVRKAKKDTAEEEREKMAQDAAGLVRAIYAKKSDIKELVESEKIVVVSQRDNGLILIADSDTDVYYERFKKDQDRGKGPKDAAYRIVISKGKVPVDEIYLSNYWAIMHRRDLLKDGL